jgi:solute carrier family 25 thiamine pyrophosphate transporter 19
MSEQKKLKGYQEALSGAIAGITSRFVIAPFDVVKIRFQLQSNPVELRGLGTAVQGEQKYVSVIQAARRIVQEEGLIGLWKGNLAATYLYFCYGGVQFFTYHQLKEMAQKDVSIFHYIPQSWDTFVAGACAGFTATTLTYPFDTLRTRFAAQSGQHYRSLLGAVKDIVATEGVRGLYKGLVPSLVSIVPQMGLVFEFHRYFREVFYRWKWSDTRVGGYQEFLCGGMAGMASKTLLMPLDVIRYD